MKRRDKVRKIAGNRLLWGMVGWLLVIYYFVVVTCGLDNFKDIYKMYWDLVDFWSILILTALAIYMARIEKDFYKGFKIAFSRRVSVSRMELQKAVNALGYTEKMIILITIFLLVFPLTDIFYHMDNVATLGPVLGVLSLQILYPTLLLVILYPVKARLEQLSISYMEEPEDSGKEQSEAEAQRLYFRLRAQGLTDRETEVARLVACGMSNVEIGKELYISVATVKKHMTHILEKMQCSDREELAERVRGL